MSESLPADLAYRGRPDRVRVKASLLDQVGGGCPGRLNLATRPGVAPADRSVRRPEPWPFLLGAVVGAVTSVHRGVDEQEAIRAAGREVSRSGVTLHALARSFLDAAVWNYLEAHDERVDEVGPLSLVGERQITHGNRELTAWGLYYESPDGALREVRRLRVGSARDGAESHRWAAVAAKLALDGTTADGRQGDGRPDRVTVVEVGLGDGGTAVVADLGSQAQVRDFYQREARPVIAELISGTRLSPGRDCDQCGWLSTCPAMPRAAGLLGLAEPATHTRSVSASELDRYHGCPARYFGDNVLHLPKEDGVGPAQLRGLAVHRWLAAAHARPDAVACVVEDLPEPGTGVPAHQEVLTDSEYEAAWPFLRQHVDRCPLRGEAVASVRVEPVHRVHDSTADVVVAASPDLVYRAGAARRWRETKSTLGHLPAGVEDAMVRYLALAVDVLMLAAVVRADAHQGGAAVELEVLGREEARVYTVDVTDEALLAAARRRVADAAAPWSRDLDFRPRPSSACGTCPVGGWCPSRGERPAEVASASRAGGAAAVAVEAPPF
ncbi:PD-(D/E)XK nuclease family protein [Actinoalloteichus caeruleus]|uniref:PD-(D/E)XK nuclease family protein n=1 Tax=Actinoalloteichus cyanogriseus TaxID=2893586 RepID=UPI0004AB754A|nr:PD-(D/E)XK nuclease family protein [Actinoalloteichus caeruleus]